MDMYFRSDRLKASCLPSWLVDVSAGASAVAMPPPFSPLFVRLLFAISFFRAQSEDSPRAGFRVSASCQYDLNDASQKGKFPRGSSSSSVGLPSRCVTQNPTSLAARPQSTEGRGVA